jgi:hypothetical protein
MSKVLALCLLASSLLVATGCPEDDDNNASNGASDAGQADADATEDVSDDTDADDATDGFVSDVEEDVDASEDLTVNCRTRYITPLTLPRDAVDATITWHLACERPFDVDDIGQTVSLQREREAADVEPTVSDVTCTEEEGYALCQVVMGSIATPVMSFDQAIGPERISFKPANGSTLEGIIRWHMPSTEVQQRQISYDITPLPGAFAERGLGFSAATTATSQRYIFGAMASESGDAIEVFSVDGSSEPPTSSVDATILAAPADILTSRESKDTTLERSYWMTLAFDDSTSTFNGEVIAYGNGGDVEEQTSLDSSGYTGPGVNEVLSTHVGVSNLSGMEMPAIRMLAITDRSTLGEFVFFGGASANGLSIAGESDLGSSTVVSRDYLVPSTARLDVNSPIPLGVTTASGAFQIPARGSTPESAVSLATGLTVDRAHLAVSPDERRVLVNTLTDTTDGGQASRLFMVERDMDGVISGSRELVLPKGIDVQPGSVIPEASQLKYPNLQGSGQLDFYVENDRLVVAGFWKALEVPMLLEWNLSALPSDGSGATPSEVRPLLPGEVEAGELSSGRALAGYMRDGSVGFHARDSILTTWESLNAEQIELLTSTPNGWSIHVVPGAIPSLAVGRHGSLVGDANPIDVALAGAPVLFDIPADKGAFMMVAPVDDAKGTHAVWIARDDGSLSSAGLVEFDGLDSVLTPTSGEGTDHGWGGNYFSAAGGEPTVVLSLGSTRTSDRQSSWALIKVTFSDLQTATESQEPVTVPLAGMLSGQTFGTTPHFLEPPPAGSRSNETIATGLTDANGTFELSPDQTGVPLVLFETTAGLTLHTIDSVAADQPLALTEVASFDFDAGASPTLGAGGQVLYSSCCSGGRIRRIRMRRRGDYSSVNWSDPSSSGSAVTEVAVEAMTLPDRIVNGAAPTDIVIGDFNGDGLEDVALLGTGDTTTVEDRGGDWFSWEENEQPDMLTMPPGGITWVWPRNIERSTTGNGTGMRMTPVAAQPVQPMDLGESL